MADGLNFGIRLTADGSAFVGTMQVSEKEIKKFAESMQKAGGAATRSFKEGREAGNYFSEGVSEISSRLKQLVSIAAAIEFGRKFIEAGDAMTTLNAKLQHVTDGLGEFVRLQDAMARLSSKMQYGVGEVTKGFIELNEAMREMGESSSASVKVTETLVALARLEGQTTGEAAGTVERFARVLTMGVEGGRDFAAMLRENGELSRNLAAALGRSTTELKRMAQDGQITANMLIEAFTAMNSKVVEDAAHMPKTVAGGFRELWNEVEKGAGGSGFLKMLSDALYGTAIAFRWVRDNAASYEHVQRLLNIRLTEGLDAARKFNAEYERQGRGQAGGVIRQGERPQSDAERAAWESLLMGTDTESGIRLKTKREKDAIVARYAELRLTTQQEIDKASSEALAMLNAADEKQRVALEAIWKRGKLGFSQYAAELDKLAEVQIGAAQAREKVEAAFAQQQLDILDHSHQMGLVSERQYLDQREAIMRGAAASMVESLKAQYEATLAEYRKLDAAAVVGVDQIAEKRGKLADLQKKLNDLVVLWSLAEQKAGDAAREAGQGVEVYQKRLAASQLAINQQLDDYERSLAKTLEDQQFAITLAGRDAEATAFLTAQRRVLKEADDKVYEIEKKIADLREQGGKSDEIAQLRAQQNEIIRGAKSWAAAVGEGARQEVVAAEKANTLRDAWNTIDNTVWTFVDKLRTNWHDAMQYMKDQLINLVWRTLYEMTVQRFMVNIFANVTGAGGGTFAGSSPATAGVGAVFGGMGGIGNLGGAAAGLFGGGAGGGGLLGAASGFGGAQTAAIDSLLINSGFSSLAEKGVGSALGPLRAAAPYIAAAVAIGMMVKSFLDGKKGGPKQGGFATSGMDRGSFFPGESTPQADATAKQLVDNVQKAYGDMLAALGGKGAAGFAFGFDTDPQGKAPNRLHSSVAVGGRLAYERAAGDLGRDDATLQAEMQLEAKRMLLAALKASDLPAQIAAVMATVNESTATAAQVDDLMAFASAMKQVIDATTGSVAADATQAYAEANESALETVRKLGARVTELAGKMDGSTASMQALGVASAQFRQAAVAALVAIKALQASLREMFAQTREQVEFAGLSKQEAYNTYREKGFTLTELLDATTDPAMVQKYAQKINEYFLSAFNLLSPEEQLAHKAEFLASLNDVDAAVTKKLDDLGISLTSETEAPFAAAQKALDDAAVKFQSASDDQVKSANEMTAAVEAFSAAVDKFDGATINVQVGGYAPAVGG